MLNNNVSYIQLAFDLVPQKDSYYVHDDTDAFSLFLLQKDFDIFHVFLFGTFLCVFLQYLVAIFIYKKNL